MTTIETKILLALEPQNLDTEIPAQFIEDMYQKFKNIYSWERFLEAMEHFGFQGINPSHYHFLKDVKREKTVRITMVELAALRVVAVELKKRKRLAAA